LRDCSSILLICNHDFLSGVVIASHYKVVAPEHANESLTAFIMLKIVLVCCLAATAYGNQYFINFSSYFIFNMK